MRSLTVRQNVQQEMVGPFGKLYALYQIYRHHLLLLMYFLHGILAGTTAATYRCWGAGDWTA
jgi:hypothetical protein